MKKTLSEHLNNSIDNRVDESIILASIVCASCIGYAVTPMLDTDFFKSVGAGIGGLLNGVGGLFGNLTGGLSKNKVGEIKELLKKDPDDLTGKEKALLQKYSKNKKLKDELSNNELKQLNTVLGSAQTDDEPKDEPTEEPKNEPTEEPIEEPKDNEDIKYTPEMMSGLMLLAKKANEQEKDKTKKEENDAMLNMLAACSYDKDGNEIPMEERLEKMKDMVGEEHWDSFKSDMEKRYEENKDNEEFKKALENAKKNLTEADAETFINDTKENAKNTLKKIEEDKKEQERIDNELANLDKQINGNNEDDEVTKLKEELKKLQEEKEQLISNSIVAKASPATGQEMVKSIEGSTEETKEETNKEETNKDGYIEKEEEIKDPKTGEKKKVKTYTGPRGGKFYYPDGKPKTPENKIYVENMSLSSYLNARIYEEKTSKEDSKNEKQKIKISEDNLKNMYKLNIKRLAYISYLIDTEEDKGNVKKLKSMYDVLSDLVFKSGKPRTISDLIKHTKDILKDNNGHIPNLPSDSVLKSLDTKMIRFEDYDEDTLNSYIQKEEKKYKIAKTESGKKSDAEQILDAGVDYDKDVDIKDYITELELIEDANKGFCRAISIIDITSGISVDKSDIPDEDDKDAEINAEEGSDNDDAAKQIDNLSDDEKDVASNIQAIINLYLDNYEDDEYNEESVEEFIKGLKPDEHIKDEKARKNFINAVKEGIKQQLNPDNDIDDDDLDTEEVESVMESILNGNFNFIFEADKDKSDKDKITTDDRAKQSVKSAGTKAKKLVKGAAKGAAVTAGVGVAGASVAAGAIANAATVKGAIALTANAAKIGATVGKTVAASNGATGLALGKAAIAGGAEGAAVGAKLAAAASNIMSSSIGPAVTTLSSPAFAIGGAAVVGLIAAGCIYRAAKKKQMKKMAAGLKAELDAEKDPKKKKELQAHYDQVMTTCFDEDGKPRTRPKMSKLSPEEREKFKETFNKNIKNKDLKKRGKEALKNKTVNFKDDKILANKHNEANTKPEDKKSEETKKNKDGYIEKEEVVKDPETGKKIKVKTYTGPRGGKFYYPDGKPKKPENKVYVESISLKEYLNSIF